MRFYSSGGTASHCTVCGKPFRPYPLVANGITSPEYCAGNHYQQCEQCGWNVIDVTHTRAECERLQEISGVANAITQYLIDRDGPPQHTAIPAAFYKAFADKDLQP